MFPGQLRVDDSTIERGFSGRDNDKDVGVEGEFHDEHTELSSLETELDKLRVGSRQTGMLGETLLERLDDIAETFEAVLARVHLADRASDMGNHKEGRTFEEDNLLGFERIRQSTQVILDDVDVRDQHVDDSRPRLVKRLIPDGGGESRDLVNAAAYLDHSDAFAENAFAEIIIDQVHLVDHAENDGRGATLGEGPNDGCISDKITIEFTRFDVEDVNQDADVGEDVIGLGTEVILDEGILSRKVISTRDGPKVVKSCPLSTTHPPQSQRLRVKLPRRRI